MPTLSDFNVTWNTPGKDADDSMLLGNGDIGLNAWVEDSGDVLFYIGKIDSWGDNGRLLKIGRVRVSISPAPDASPFFHTLELADATMSIRWGEGAAATECRLWVDANHPVIQVEIDSPNPVETRASIELWRTEPCELPTITLSDVYCGYQSPEELQGQQAAEIEQWIQMEKTVVEPDTVLQEMDNRIGWVHRNIKSVGPEIHGALQGFADFPRDDPLLHRTFGAVLWAETGQRTDDLLLTSPRATRHRISAAVLTRHPSTEAEWLRDIDTCIEEFNAEDPGHRRHAHEQWWTSFWDRSWIHASCETRSDALQASQAYARQRFVQASSGRGAYPIKFNGSIFTVPYGDQPGDADWRRWGPGYWWQNTRFPYFAMLAAGDFDCMESLFKMYCRDLHELNRYRTKAYTGADGVFIPETIYFWGDTISNTYGWTPWEEREDKLQPNEYHKYEFICALELAFIALEYYLHTEDEAFLQNTALPFTYDALLFFDSFYRTNQAGTLVMEPAQACETWWICTNPMPELAGLYAVTERILALPSHLLDNRTRDLSSRLRAKLPDLPTRTRNGKRMLAPAERFEREKNEEHPELYAVFPFRQFAVGRPDIEPAIEALHHRDNKSSQGWHQDDTFMAYLGLTDEARENLMGRVSGHGADHFVVAGEKVTKSWRFPVYWGPNYDWAPDQAHGGMLMITYQAMLFQHDGDRMFLFPAWPRDWDVDFKLHGPLNTTVKGCYKNGKLISLHVTPVSRKDDITICL